MPPLPSFQAVIFDMDGLLFDTEALYQRAWPEVGRAMGLTITAEIARETIGVATKESEAIFQKYCGISFSIDHAFAEMKAWLIAHVERYGLPEKPGARELLTLLHMRKFPIALGTSNIEEVAHAFLDEAGLRNYFSVIVCGDMVDKVKPAPDIFLRCAKELKIPPADCLVLEDSPVGIHAAHAAACIPVLIPDLIDANKETKELAHAVYPSLLDLIPLIERAK